MGSRRSEMHMAQIELKEIDRIIDMIESEGELKSVLNNLISNDEKNIVESL